MKRIGQFFNIIIWIFLAFMFVQKFQTWSKETKQEGLSTKSTNIEMLSLDGSVFNKSLFDPNSKKIIIFWATWCGPCRLELSRVQKLIDEKKINPQSIIAISVAEEAQTVLHTAKKRNYTFPVGLDPDGSIANQFQIQATPTIVLLDKGRISFISSGLSLLLEKKITDFLNKSL